MDTELAENLEKYIGQKRIWISKPDCGFAEEFLGKTFKISGFKKDMDGNSYFTYFYNVQSEKNDNRRSVNQILENSAEVSPVLKELFD